MYNSSAIFFQKLKTDRQTEGDRGWERVRERGQREQTLFNHGNLFNTNCFSEEERKIEGECWGQGEREKVSRGFLVLSYGSFGGKALILVVVTYILLLYCRIGVCDVTLACHHKMANILHYSSLILSSNTKYIIFLILY